LIDYYGLNFGVVAYVSAVTGQSARSRTDAHADRSTFVPRKAAISGFATNPTRTFFANARKADRNHGFMFCGRSVRMRSCAQISFYDRQNFHFMTDKFHFMPDPTLLENGEAVIEVGFFIASFPADDVDTIARLRTWWKEL
jgi:hypothetical protein